MATALANLEERIAKLEAAAEQIRSETRAAHEATKDLRRARAEVEHLLSTTATELVETAIQAAVEAGLADYVETVKAATAHAEQHIESQFKRLRNTYLTGRLSGDGESLEDVWKATIR